MHAAPSVATEPPPGWVVADVAQPAIGGGSGATFTQWNASRSLATGDVLLLGCVATPIPGWVEDMRPSVQARTTSLMAASTERIVGSQVETSEDTLALALRPVGAPRGTPPVGSARTFVGWDAHAVVTCFAVCARPAASSCGTASRECDASVVNARLVGGTVAPPPGLALGALTWAVHHPTKTVAFASVVTFAVGVLAVLLRRRPRSRI